MSKKDTKVVREASFGNDLGADLLAAVVIVIELEECFGLIAHDGEEKKIKTVGETIDWIVAKLKTEGRLIK